MKDKYKCSYTCILFWQVWSDASIDEILLQIGNDTLNASPSLATFDNTDGVHNNEECRQQDTFDTECVVHTESTHNDIQTSTDAFQRNIDIVKTQDTVDTDSVVPAAIT